MEQKKETQTEKEGASEENLYACDHPRLGDSVVSPSTPGP